MQQRLEQVKFLLEFPAFSVRLYLRRDLGYRYVNPIRVLVVTVIILVVAALSQKNRDDDTPLFLVMFACGAFVSGIAQRFKGWMRLNRGVYHHSMYVGTSVLEFSWLPYAIRRNRRVSRVIDPLLCALIGLALRPVSGALSGWLILSGLALYISEFGISEREQNVDLDTIDGLINAERQSRVVEQFEDAQDSGPQRQDTGIPTGLGQDVKEHIKNRKRRSPS